MSVFGLPATCDRFLSNERKWILRWIGWLRAAVSDVYGVVSIEWPLDSASCVVSNPNSFFRSCGSCLLRLCWAVACLWLTVLLHIRHGQIWSERHLPEIVIIRQDALLRRTSVRSSCCLTILVGVELFMAIADWEGGMTVYCDRSGSSV